MQSGGWPYPNSIEALLVVAILKVKQPKMRFKSIHIPLVCFALSVTV